MKPPMAEVPAASKAGANEDGDTAGAVTPPAQPAAKPASQDGQGMGRPAGALGSDRAKIGNWPDPM
jgi:hypothetical protein